MLGRRDSLEKLFAGGDSRNAKNPKQPIVKLRDAVRTDIDGPTTHREWAESVEDWRKLNQSANTEQGHSQESLAQDFEDQYAAELYRQWFNLRPSSSDLAPSLPQIRKVLEASYDCKICLRINKAVKFYLGDLQASASNGCASCRTITKSLMTGPDTLHDLESTLDDVRISEIKVFPNGNTSIQLSIDRINDWSKVPTIFVLVFGNVACQDPDIINTRMYDIPGLTDICDVIGRWRGYCSEDHSSCTAPSPDYIPRRLLSIEPNETSCILVERDRVKDATVSYVTLSYCWGNNSNTFRTTRENYSDNLEKIPLRLIPRTIRDALTVCQVLEIKYLWVDALCIIQNDIKERDWYEQSAEMSQIYSNAHFVLSADASPDSEFGFLPGRGWNFEQWKAFESKGDLPNTMQAFLRRRYVEHEVLWRGRPWDGTTLSPLSNRAWPFQERTLATRVLHFTESGMRWECNQQTPNIFSKMTASIRLRNLTGTNPGLLRRQVVISNDMDSDSTWTVDLPYILNELSPNSIYQAWQGIVNDYTARKLTRPGDKLSALSGLAKFTAQSLQVDHTEYLAGLWFGDLIQSLFWFVVEPVERTTSLRPDYYRAPSWSWASVDGRVRYFQERFQFHWQDDIQVLAASCSPSRFYTFGRVTTGYIIARGCMLKCQLTIETGAPPAKSQYGTGNGRAPHVYVDQVSWVSDGTTRYEVLLDEPYTSNISGKYATVHCFLIGYHEEKRRPMKPFDESDRAPMRRRFWLLVLSKLEVN